MMFQLSHANIAAKPHYVANQSILLYCSFEIYKLNRTFSTLPSNKSDQLWDYFAHIRNTELYLSHKLKTHQGFRMQHLTTQWITTKSIFTIRISKIRNYYEDKIKFVCAWMFQKHTFWVNFISTATFIQNRNIWCMFAKITKLTCQ